MKNTIKNLNKRIVLLAMLFVAVTALAYGGNDEDTTRQSAATQVASAPNVPSTVSAEHDLELTADLDDFPNLHPLVVHFAIVLLLVGASLQAANVYFMRPLIAWIAFCIAAAGALPAYLAGGPYHAHTHGLPEHAKLVLAQHDSWADWTLYLGGAGVVLQGLNLVYLTNKRWAVAGVAAVLLGSGFSVAKAGHYGSQLVYIEGIGPQGKYVESESTHAH
jgi:uncharacterized membrane protein